MYQKTGVNHVDGIDRNASVLTETAIRYAHVWNQQWAFKINAGYIRATDWVSNMQTDQNPNNSARPILNMLNSMEEQTQHMMPGTNMGMRIIMQ